MDGSPREDLARMIRDNGSPQESDAIVRLTMDAASVTVSGLSDTLPPCGWRHLKLAIGRPYVLALVDSGTVPAFKCDCLRVAGVFMR